MTERLDGAEIPVARRWQEILLSPDATSEAYRRLSGVLNILKNGAQTLEVLSMVDDPHSFDTVGNIKRSMDKKAGGMVVKGHIAVKHHLALCIEPVGAAARSTLDDEMWALTPFGIEMKASLVFAWSKFLEDGIHPMNVLGTTSISKKDDEGNITSTPAVSRAATLTTLDEYGMVNEQRLIEILKLSNSAISQHLIKLRSAGLVNFESVDMSGSNAATRFTLTEKGKEQRHDWPVYVDSQGRNQILRTDLIKNALDELSVAGQEITTVSICKIILDKRSDYNRESLLNQTSNVLAFWIREGLLDKGRFKKGYFSEVSLTEKGHLVVDKIIEPLAMWSLDPTLTPEITSIAQRLRVNHDAYQSIYPDIAGSFMETSPNLERAKDEITDKVFEAIRQKPGLLTARDVARTTGISVTYAHQLVTELRTQGLVIGSQINKQRILLSVV